MSAAAVLLLMRRWHGARGAAPEAAKRARRGLARADRRRTAVAALTLVLAHHAGPLCLVNRALHGAGLGARLRRGSASLALHPTYVHREYYELEGNVLRWEEDSGLIKLAPSSDCECGFTFRRPTKCLPAGPGA